MAKNYVADGATLDFHNAGSTVIESGAPIAVGSKVMVALVDIAPGAIGTLSSGGVWKLPKAAAADITLCADVYLDSTGKIVAASGEGTTHAGVAWSPAGNGTTEVEVKIG